MTGFYFQSTPTQDHDPASRGSNLATLDLLKFLYFYILSYKYPRHKIFIKHFTVSLLNILNAKEERTPCTQA